MLMYINNIWNMFINNFLLKVPDLILKLFESLIVLIIAALAIKFGKIMITKFFSNQKKLKYTIDDKRADTLSTLLSSILKYTVYLLAVLTIINSIFDVKITTILTAAGIGGIAIGFGAQSLVKDVITGFFILLEDQFAVGDSVTIDGMTGTVEEIEMRITKIRHFNGDLFIIPNGQIIKVTNHTRGSKTAIIDIRVSYQEDLDKVIEILNKTALEVAKDFEVIIEEPKVLGITEFSPTDVTLRVIAKTLPNENAPVEREMRKRIKEAFDKEGIVIPYTKKVIVAGNNEFDNELLK